MKRLDFDMITSGIQDGLSNNSIEIAFVCHDKNDYEYYTKFVQQVLADYLNQKDFIMTDEVIISNTIIRLIKTYKESE